MSVPQRDTFRRYALLCELSLVWSMTDTTPAILLGDRGRRGDEGEPILEPVPATEVATPLQEPDEVLSGALPRLRSFREELDHLAHHHGQTCCYVGDLMASPEVVRAFAITERTDPSSPRSP